MLVRDFKPLGWVQGDGQILKVRLDSWHGEDSVKRQKVLLQCRDHQYGRRSPQRGMVTGIVLLAMRER